MTFNGLTLLLIILVLAAVFAAVKWVLVPLLGKHGGHRAERDLAREAAEYVMYLKHGHFWRYTVLLARLQVTRKLIEVAEPLVSAGSTPFHQHPPGGEPGSRERLDGPAATTTSPVRPSTLRGPRPGEEAAARGVAPAPAPLPLDWEDVLAGINDLAARARAETDAAYQQAIAGLGRCR